MIVGKLRGTVAVVDDDASLRRSVGRLLYAYGFPAIEYQSAEAFLDRDPNILIDCLVLDIDLGGMSGIELQHKLKEAGSKLPVIFITALEDPRLKNQAEQAGCIAYLRKPFAGVGLIDAVKKAIGS